MKASDAFVSSTVVGNRIFTMLPKLFFSKTAALSAASIHTPELAITTFRPPIHPSTSISSPETVLHNQNSLSAIKLFPHVASCRATCDYQWLPNMCRLQRMSFLAHANENSETLNPKARGHFLVKKVLGFEQTCPSRTVTHLVEKRRVHERHLKRDDAAIAGAQHIDPGMHPKVAQHGNQALRLKGFRAPGIGRGGLSEEDEVGDIHSELLQESLQLQLPCAHAIPPKPMHQQQGRLRPRRWHPAVHGRLILQTDALRLHPQPLKQASRAGAASLHCSSRHSRPLCLQSERLSSQISTLSPHTLIGDCMLVRPPRTEGTCHHHSLHFGFDSGSASSS